MARGIGSFFIGVLIKEMYENLDKTYYKKIYGAVAVFGAVLIFAALLNQVKLSIGIGVQTIFMMFLSVAFILMSLTITPIKFILSTKFFVWLGKISMDVYLWHIPAQLIIKNTDSYFNMNLNYGSRIVWIFYAFLVLGIATMSNRALSKGIENKEGKIFSTTTLVLIAILSIGIRLTGPILIHPIDNNLTWNGQSQIVYPRHSSSEPFGVHEDLNDVELSFYTVTWNNEYPQGARLSYSIIDDQNNIKIQGEYDLKIAQDGRVGTIALDGVLANGNYKVVFDVLDNNDTPFALMSNHDGTVALKVRGKKKK